MAVRNMERNLKTHGSVHALVVTKLGRPPAIDRENKDALFAALIRLRWMYQDEIVHWLAVEGGVTISRSAVSKFLRREEWSRQTDAANVLHRSFFQTSARPHPPAIRSRKWH
jgi:transposase